jgi:transposase
MNTDLTDEQWVALEPLLLPPPIVCRGGRPRHRSRRELIDGMRWRFRTGSRWDRLPARHGPYQTTAFSMPGSMTVRGNGWSRLWARPLKRI